MSTQKTLILNSIDYKFKIVQMCHFLQQQLYRIIIEMLVVHVHRYIYSTLL